MVLKDGVVDGEDLRLSGSLTMDGTDQATSLRGDLVTYGGELTLLNGGLLTRRSDTLYSEIEDSAKVKVSGISADGRRSIWTSHFIQAGSRSNGNQEIRVEDGGAISVGMLWLSEVNGSGGSTSTMVVTGRHANGTASTLNAGLIRGGRSHLQNTTAHLVLEQGAIANVGSINMGGNSTITVTGIEGSYETELNVDEGIELTHQAKMTITAGGMVTANHLNGRVTVSGTDTFNVSSLILTGQWGLEADKLLVEKGGFASAAYLTGRTGGVASITGTEGARGMVETGGFRGRPGSEIGVDGGILFLSGSGDVDGDSEVAIRIGKNGLWLETPLDVILDGRSLVGEGGLWKDSGGSLDLTGSNTYTGGTVIKQGALVVNNTSGSATGSGDIHIRHGATLTGGGVVAGNVHNSGTLAPGNSPGTLRVRGNYHQKPDGTLEIEAGPSGQDLLLVDGRVRLAGNLVIDNDGVLQFGDGLTFLRTGSTIEGEFDSITFTHAQEGRTRLMTRDGEVSLVIAPDSYTQIAATPNEARIAAALDNWIDDGGGDTAAVVEALDHLDTAGYHVAFAALSPALFSTAVDTALEQSHAQSHMLAGHLHSRFLHGVPHDGKDWHAWAISGGMYSSGSMSSLKGDDFTSGAFLTGISRMIAPAVEAGLFVGSGESEGSFHGATRTEQERLALGLYALAGTGGFHASGAVGAGTLDLETRREITFGPLSRIARSDTNGIEFSGMLSGDTISTRELGPSAPLPACNTARSAMMTFAKAMRELWIFSFKIPKTTACGHVLARG